MPSVRPVFTTMSSWYATPIEPQPVGINPFTITFDEMEAALTAKKKEDVDVKKTNYSPEHMTFLCPACNKPMEEIDFDGFSHECECGTLLNKNGTFLSAAA